MTTKKRPEVPFRGMDIYDEAEGMIELTNPYSGESIEVHPEVAAVYDLIKGAEMLGVHSTVERGLDWFKQHYAKEYMVLLD